MHLEVRAGIREERKACCVRFGKSIQRKRRDRGDNPVGGLAGDAVFRHPLAQLHFDLLHPLFRSLESHRAPELLGLPARESGRDHGHAQQLLLKERHAQGPREHGLERRMEWHDRLFPRATIQIRMHHLPDDRTRADDRDFDDEVVETFGLETRERRHLRARLDLEDANRVGFLQHPVDRRIVGR